MPPKTTIAQLNRQITIKKYVFGQNDYGGDIKVLVGSYTVFASMEMISNSYVLEQMQLKYGEAWKVTIRYEPSRIITPNDEVEYNGNVHKIQGSPKYDTEAQKHFITFNTSTGNTQSNSSTMQIFTKEFHYTATGGETSFQDDYLKNWTGLILLFRDKSQYRVIRSGLPSAQQGLYDSNAGTFMFNDSIIPFAAGETIDAYLISA
jgi:SPP1 family predicted phage head-tail adaptor